MGGAQRGGIWVGYRQRGGIWVGCRQRGSGWGGIRWVGSSYLLICSRALSIAQTHTPHTPRTHSHTSHTSHLAHTHKPHSPHSHPSDFVRLIPQCLPSLCWAAKGNGSGIRTGQQPGSEVMPQLGTEVMQQLGSEVMQQPSLRRGSGTDCRSLSSWIPHVLRHGLRTNILRTCNTLVRVPGGDYDALPTYLRP